MCFNHLLEKYFIINLLRFGKMIFYELFQWFHQKAYINRYVWSEIARLKLISKEALNYYTSKYLLFSKWYIKSWSLDHMFEPVLRKRSTN